MKPLAKPSAHASEEPARNQTTGREVSVGYLTTGLSLGSHIFVRFEMPIDRSNNKGTRRLAIWVELVMLFGMFLFYFGLIVLMNFPFLSKKKKEEEKNSRRNVGQFFVSADVPILDSF